jgi:uncharacterized coiled-coil DUF342 family protein
MQYIINKKGQKTSVLVPYKDWERLNNVAKLQKKLEVLTGINEGLQEIRSAKKNGKKLKTLTEALNEL